MGEQEATAAAVAAVDEQKPRQQRRQRSHLHEDDHASDDHRNVSGGAPSETGANGLVPDGDSARRANNGDPVAAGDPGPKCKNCCLRHPADDGLGHFCTEGKQSLLESFVAMVTLGLVCGWCYMVVITMVLLLLYTFVFGNIYTLVAFVYLLSEMLWPVDDKCYPRDGFVNSWIFRVWRRYFRWQCVIEENLDPGKRYMFAEMPHGVMPVAQFLSCSIVRQAFPGVGHISGVAADMVLRMPGIRTMYALMGVRRAGRKSILGMFENKINVAVVVGGIAEMFMVSKKTERLYLKKRKNFTRIAIEAGADIVPVYFFGNTLLHDLVGGEGSDNLLYRLSRKFKTALVIFYGRFGTPIPRRERLKMVTGRPIKVVASNDPSPEYVDAIHEELLKRVEEMYYRHRPSWETRELVIT